ncbi:MAG: O-antigen ligase family protein [Bacteroidetes bacterium]|nr:O-antigen ligase family protein [Bacteroidota bacterium]
MIKNYDTKYLLFKISFILLCVGTLCDTMLFTNLNFGFFHINIETPKTVLLIYIGVFFLITDYKFSDAFDKIYKKFVLFVILIFLSALLSSVMSTEKEKAFKTLFNYLSYFVCLLITLKHLKQFNQAGNFILKSFLVINFLLAVSCILDFYIQQFNQFLIDHFGHNELKHSFFKMNGEMILRPSGLTSDTNLTAFSIAVSLVLVILNYSKFKNKILIWVFILCSGFAFGMLSSRSAQIIILLSGILFIIFKKVNYKTILQIVIVFFVVQLATPQTIARIQQFFSKEAMEEEATYGRSMIWRGAWLAFQENKVIGLGPGVFFNKSIDYISRTMDKAKFDTLEKSQYNPHNIFLVFLSEQGIIGAIIFLSLLIFLLNYFVRQKKYLSLIFLLCILIVSSLSNYAPYFKYYLIICLVIYSLDKQNYQLKENAVNA